MDLKVIKLSAIVLIALSTAPSLLGLGMTETESVTDYLLFIPGHSNTFTVSDDNLVDCTVELVFQTSKEYNYFITLTKIGEAGGYWRDSAIYIGEHDDLLTAWGGAPVGNQAHYFWLLHTIPATFSDGNTWINEYSDTSYRISYVDEHTVNGVSYSDCIRLQFNSTNHPRGLYFQGVGEAYLAKDIGIIELTFLKTDGNDFTATLKEQSNYAQRSISGNFMLDDGSPAWGYSVGLSNFVNVGYDATLVDVNGFYSLPFYGSSVILRYGPISMDGESLILEYSQETKINGGVGDIVDYNLTAPAHKDLILKGDEELIIENCVYNHYGNIFVSDNARLILRNATLVLYWQNFHEYDIDFNESSYFESFNSTITAMPGSYDEGGYYLFMKDSAEANITSSRFHYPATLLDARGQDVTVKIRDSHLDNINIGSHSNVEINNSQANIHIYSQANVIIRDSENIGYLHLSFGGSAYAELSLQPGYHSDWSLQENETVIDCDIYVNIINSTISGWGLRSHSQSEIKVTDSVLNSVVSLVDGSFNLENVIVTSRISSEGNSIITFRDSTVNRINTQDFSKVQMVNTFIDGEVNVFDDSEIHVGWYLDASAINEAGAIEGALVDVFTMPELSLIDSKMTNEEGIARFELWEKILRANGETLVNNYNIDCEYQEVRISEEILLTINDELQFDFTGIHQYSVSGTVYFGSTPLEDILVELTIYGEETPILSTTTSPEGFYSFLDVAPGLYWVTAYAPPDQGYVPNMGYRFVEVIDEDVTKDIDLPKLLTLLSPEDDSYVTTSNPTFEWEAFPDAVRYSISIHEVANWDWSIWEASIPTIHTLETELSDGKEYGWTIYAYDSNDHLIGSAWPWWSFTITKPTQAEVQIGEILFISEKGKILHSMRTGQVFNILVLVEKINPEWGWTPLWLDLYIDGVRYASHGTGVNQGFIVLSTSHDSFNYNERGKHTVRVELFERLGDEKGELLEEKTISFKIKGKPLKHPPF